MPALDIFTEQVQQPILLELTGGSKLWTICTFEGLAWTEHCFTLSHATCVNRIAAIDQVCCDGHSFWPRSEGSKHAVSYRSIDAPWHRSRIEENAGLSVIYLSRHFTGANIFCLTRFWPKSVDNSFRRTKTCLTKSQTGSKPNLALSSFFTMRLPQLRIIFREI